MSRNLLSCLVCITMSSSILNAQIKHRFLIIDQSGGKITQVDQFNAANNWSVSTAPYGNNRDAQLIGNDRVMVSVEDYGYLEINLKTGAIVRESPRYGGIRSARRLPNGHTLLVGDNLQGLSGTTILELDSLSVLVRKFSYPQYSGFRLLRRTPQNTFMFGSWNVVAEGDTSGRILWHTTIDAVPGQQSSIGIGGGSTNVYQAVRQKNGNILLTLGHAGTMAIIKPDGTPVKTWGGLLDKQRSQVNPCFYAMFQVLANGHIVVANYASDISIVEYDTAGTMVWSYHPTGLGWVHGVLVIDSLDTKLMYDDADGGELKPIGPQATAVRLGNNSNEENRQRMLSSISRPHNEEYFDLGGRIVGCSRPELRFGTNPGKIEKGRVRIHAEIRAPK